MLRMKKSPPKPTDAELAILQVLWRYGPATVKEVQEKLAAGTGYTTALKFLQIMTEKGLVRRNESERAHVYEATSPESDVQRDLVAELLKKAFGGSPHKLVMQALSSKKASPGELAEIRRLIEKLGKGKS
jgi:predicted transcriptional regulator